MNPPKAHHDIEGPAPATAGRLHDAYIAEDKMSQGIIAEGRSGYLHPVPLTPPRLDARPHHLHLRWLLKLRWVTLGCQLVLVLTAMWLLKMQLPIPWVAGLLVLSVALNLLLSGWAQRAGQVVSEGGIAAIVVLDNLLLTALLWLTGGPMNPFSFLYLVQIALGAVVLSARWNIALVVLSILAYGSLFLLEPFTQDHAGHHDHDLMDLHLQGMWVAFTLTAPALALGVGRVRAALKRYEVELAVAAEDRERAAQLESLTTLAAGTAHELSSPLATIAIAAREMERAAENQRTDRLVEDARLVRAEVERCRGILQQMAADLGGGMGETLAWQDLRGWIEGELSSVPERAQLRVEVPSDGQVRVAPRLMGQVLRALIQNGLDASGPGQTVTLRGEVRGGLLHLQVQDEGKGMDPLALTRSVEPFFTTKAAGHGLGLGLFFCRSVVQRLGGELTLHSELGRGTTAQITLPQPTLGASELGESAANAPEEVA